VWKSEYGNERDEERKKLTVLFRKPSARCWNPSLPNQFAARSSVVIVCEERYSNTYRKRDEK
jgi:hypothetical protein